MFNSRLLPVAMIAAAFGVAGCGGGGGGMGSLQPLPTEQAAKAQLAEFAQTAEAGRASASAPESKTTLASSPAPATAPAAPPTPQEPALATAPADPPTPQEPAPIAIGQLDGHGFPATFTIDAGESRSDGRGSFLTCAGGPDCEVTIAEGTVSTTAGTLAIAVDPMLRAANSGTEGDTDGGHARSLLAMIAGMNVHSGNGLRSADPKHRSSSIGRQSNLEQSTLARMRYFTGERPLREGCERPRSSTATLSRVAWSNANDAPVFGLTVPNSLFGDSPELAEVFLSTPVSAPEGTELIPMASLGSGWNSGALQRTAEGKGTIYANVHTNISQTVHLRPPSELFDLSGIDVGESGPIEGSFHTYLEDPHNPEKRASVRIKLDPEWLDAERRLTRQDFGSVFAQGDSFDVSLKVAYTNMRLGKMECASSSGCELADGRIQGEWRLAEADFVPEADQEYVTFGTWMSVPSSDDSSFGLGAFAGGPRAYHPHELGWLVGSVTYEGPAAGAYVVGTFAAPEEGEGPFDLTHLEDVADARVGTFVAKASLAVRFSRSYSPEKSGSIHTFVDTVTGDQLGGSEDGWVLQLSRDGFTSGDLDGRHVEGRWGARYYPDGRAPDGKIGPGDVASRPTWDRNWNLYPNLMAGTFSASTLEEAVPHSQGSIQVLGSFGARRQ